MAIQKIVLDKEEIVQLARDGATDAEIAAHYHCRESTITFRATPELKRGRLLMCMDIRKAQIELAKSGNSAMLAFLGKEYLGQTGKPQSHAHDDSTDATPHLDSADLHKIIEGSK